MSWFTDLFQAKKPVKAATAAGQEAQKRKSPYLTQTVVFGMHLYRQRGEDSSVYFVDEDRGIRKLLVDSLGKIQHFPGIKDREAIAKNLTHGMLDSQIRFRTSFERRGDRWIMLWQVQPDGRYWEDEDGFGGTPDDEVTLCTYVDSNGDFTGPFELYEIGSKRYHNPPK